jgi:small subunit ribosomal protein S3
VGQKVHPYGFSLGYNKDWHSHWFAKKQYGDYLLEDLKLKRRSEGALRRRGRLARRRRARGQSPEDHHLHLAARASSSAARARDRQAQGRHRGATGREVLVSIQEIHKPELNAQLQAEKIASQLEKRIAFRRAMRKTVEESLRFGAQGIKVMVAGRLNGAEIARTEWHLQGVCRCTRCAPTSTTALPKRTRPSASSASSAGSTAARSSTRMRRWRAARARPDQRAPPRARRRA